MGEGEIARERDQVAVSGDGEGWVEGGTGTDKGERERWIRVIGGLLQENIAGFFPQNEVGDESVGEAGERGRQLREKEVRRCVQREGTSERVGEETTEAGLVLRAVL